MDAITRMLQAQKVCSTTTLLVPENPFGNREGQPNKLILDVNCTIMKSIYRFH